MSCVIRFGDRTCSPTEKGNVGSCAIRGHAKDPTAKQAGAVIVRGCPGYQTTQLHGARVSGFVLQSLNGAVVDTEFLVCAKWAKSFAGE
jgi:hypothetical protein